MRKRGISLITLIITIVVLIILAAAVMIAIGVNNPMGKAKLANVQSTRDNLLSGIGVYLSRVITKENGNYDTATILLGKNSDVKKYQIISGNFENNTTNTVVILEDKQVWQLDYSKVESLVNLKLDIYDNNSRWYIDELGNPYLVYDRLSNVQNYLKDETGNVDISVRNFVVYLNRDVEFSESSNNQSSSKQDGSITLLSKVGALAYNESLEINVLNPNNLTITAESSNTEIASVSVNGNKVTITANSNPGNATITVNGNSNDIYNSVQKEYDLIVWSGMGAMPINVAKNLINAGNISSYIGTQVDYHPANDSTGVYRIFYLDASNKYKDGVNALYLKRDLDETKTYTVASTAISDSSTYSSTELGKFNPMWKEKDNSINNNNEMYAAYFCTRSNWSIYADSLQGAEYAIGTPSVEMYMDAYNQWNGYSSGRGPQSYKFEQGNYGYSIGVNSVYPNNGELQEPNSLNTGENNVFYKQNNHWWLASPSCAGTANIVNVGGANVRIGSAGANISLQYSPVVCLGVIGDEDELSIAEAKSVINENNISDYIGVKVKYNPSGDTNGIYRVFYYDTELENTGKGKYGAAGTLFIKRDFDEDLKYYVGNTTLYANLTYSLEDLGQFNPLWKLKDNNINNSNEIYAAYLCTKSNWSSYVDVSKGAEYAIGSPTVEMYMDAYNQWNRYSDGRGPQSYKFESGDCGYSIGLNNTYSNNGDIQNVQTLNTGLNNVFYKQNTHWWLASPTRYGTSYLINVGGINARVGVSNGTYELPILYCPVVSLGN